VTRSVKCLTRDLRVRVKRTNVRLITASSAAGAVSVLGGTPHEIGN
jgi:hypothetical protein